MLRLSLIFLVFTVYAQGHFLSFRRKRDIEEKKQDIFRNKRSIEGLFDYYTDDDILSNEISRCREDEFPCRDSGECIPLREKCDRWVKCYDRSDESFETCHDENTEYPPPENCDIGDYLCPVSGECIDGMWTCDDLVHCEDRSDESYDLCVEQINKESKNAKDAYPWLVSITTLSGVHTCGGNIINEMWILTAAHCTPHKRAKLRIVAGEFNKTATSGHEKYYDVKEIINHPDYTMDYDFDVDTEMVSYYIFNDIALLKLKKPIQFDKYIQPIRLPSPYQEFTGVARLAGWGTRFWKGKSRSVLREVLLPIASKEVCTAYHGEENIRNTTICAGGQETRLTGCHGDSGGGLICEDDFGVDYVCGLTSFGDLDHCDDMEAPTVFTKVSYYIDWIMDEISEK